MPRIFWTLNFVMGVGRGCGIYSLDGQTLMYSAKAAARNPKGPWASADLERHRQDDRHLQPLRRAADPRRGRRTA